jgi:hypothetical protein
MPSQSAWQYLVNKATDAMQNTADYAKGVKQRYEERQAENAAAKAPAEPAPSTTPTVTRATTQGPSGKNSMTYLPGVGTNPMAQADEMSK